MIFIYYSWRPDHYKFEILEPPDMLFLRCILWTQILFHSVLWFTISNSGKLVDTGNGNDDKTVDCEHTHIRNPRCHKQLKGAQTTSIPYTPHIITVKETRTSKTSRTCTYSEEEYIDTNHTITFNYLNIPSNKNTPNKQLQMANNHTNNYKHITVVNHNMM